MEREPDEADSEINKQNKKNKQKKKRKTKISGAFLCVRWLVLFANIILYII